MRLKDLQVLTEGSYLLSDGINMYRAIVIYCDEFKDYDINIYKNGLPNEGNISIMQLRYDPYIHTNIGSISIFSNDVKRSIQFLEYVGRWSDKMGDNIKSIFYHKLNMRINRKLKK